MTGETHRHASEEPCEAGLELYALALREGRLRASEARSVPCLAAHGLLRPALDDLDWLEPVAPAVALHRLLRSSADRVADERRRSERLAESFERLMRLGGRYDVSPADPLITVHSQKERISHILDEAMADATEILAIQPHNSYAPSKVGFAEAALRRDQDLLDRGGRIRALYQHTLRHAPPIRARYEQLRGDVQARTLDEVTDRLILLDRTVAFIPANTDRSLALEVRQPALVAYLTTTFDRLWRLATPMYPQAVHQPTLNGITPRQRAIAALLTEGHTDADIADRLGMNVRTARVHIAKLAANLGSESRAQLGYLIGRSGILDQER
ncbi:helix-turn-helix transcriptional regulator [Streptomyces lancefieldiae]|uniref:Helix-turn-helix transcriptional regulator n=1 Tax=Streptomyces lancefieldiae TaxID=3075520 RepID=A0ABU3ASQ2_9ACTN|nr:helix-turn-helix transcriptional regulator [Streptomyces sp. DSM 40712]MDT0613222.1 helix-turn-helix transcriptional regulator [Streptomyces sp. DSM 40712]